MIRLTWEEDGKDEDGKPVKKTKSFTYEKLTDLQSRLALVAGNQDKEIESSAIIQQFIEASFVSKTQVHYTCSEISK